MKTDFDDKIKSLYNSGEFEYKEENWEKLRPKLNGQRPQFSKSKALHSFSYARKTMMIAASLIVLLGLSYFWFSRSQNDNEYTQEKLAVENRAIEKLATEKLDVATQNVKESEVAKQAVTKAMPGQIPRKKSTQSITSKTKVMNKKNENTLSSLDKNQKKNIIEYNNDPLPNIVKEEKLGEDKRTQPEISNPKSVSNEENYNPIDIGFAKPSTEKSDAGFSIQGSAGRGNNNSMYAAGVAYQVNLSKRFFVDGALALNSSSLKSVVRMESETKNLITSTPGTFAPNTTDEAAYDYVRQNTNYANIVIQPSLGYSLTKRLALKAGVDLQQRIINAKELSFIESDAVFKPLPNFDIGITPAIALKLNNHWQTNFIYRKGITSKLSKKDYYDRNYFQLLLGYKF